MSQPSHVSVTFDVIRRGVEKVTEMLANELDRVDKASDVSDQQDWKQTLTGYRRAAV